MFFIAFVVYYLHGDGVANSRTGQILGILMLQIKLNTYNFAFEQYMFIKNLGENLISFRIYLWHNIDLFDMQN